MGFVSEFKEFAVKGNVMDLAIGVIIGGAFGKIIDSVINDLVMPIVAAIIKQPDFSALYFAFTDTPKGISLEDAKKLGPVFAYGNFITVVIEFFLLALVVFAMVKTMNRIRLKEKQAAPPPPPAEPSSTDKLLMEIRDSLKK